MNALTSLSDPVPKARPHLVAELFHRLSRVLPENQVPLTVTPTTTVSEALKKMREKKLSQLPVAEGDAVLGFFSHRSFSEGILRIGIMRRKLEDLPVEEFVEKAHFARMTDEFDSVISRLDRDNAVLVGEPDGLQGIVTSIDVLRYLYDVASPFVLIAEIELAVRALICVAVNNDLLVDCAKRSLTSKYSEDNVPRELSEMEFNDYIQIVGHGENWNHFGSVFGGMRQTVRSKLEDIRDLRNEIFHFRRDLSVEEHERLADHRDWVLLKARMADERAKGGRP